jgi:DNA-binding CsgD family transcriptional regulator
LLTPTLSSNQYETLLECIERLHACPSIEAFPRVVIAAVRRAVVCDSAAYNEFHPAENRAIAILEPAPSNFPALLVRWQKCFQQNPILRYALESGDGSAHQISDFISVRELHQLDLYTQMFRELRVEHQIAFLLANPEGVSVGVALNRRRGNFSETDRQMLNRLRPHIAQAYAGLMKLADGAALLSKLRLAMEDGSEGVLLVSHRDVVLHVSSRAAQWLSDYLDWQPHSPLPASLARWITMQRSSPARSAEGEPFIREGDGRRLHGKLVDRPDQHFSTILFTEEIVALDPEACAGLGLTRMESKVLGWMAQGKSNREISAICLASEETVKKHTRSIFSKLNVDNRTAAALLARDRLAARD